MPGYVPSSLQQDYDQTLPSSPVIAGSDVAETANMERVTPGGVPSGLQTLGLPTASPEAPQTLPTPPPQKGKLDLISDGLHLLATQFQEISRPDLYHGASSALREAYRKRDLEEGGKQDLAYAMTLYQIGTPEAMAALTKATPGFRDPAAVKLAGEAVKDLRTRAQGAKLLRGMRTPESSRMADLMESGIPQSLVPAFAAELFKADQYSEQIHAIPGGGGVFWLNKRTGQLEVREDKRITVKPSADTAGKQLQDLTAFAISGMGMEQLMRKMGEGDPTAIANGLEVLRQLGNKPLTNELDQAAFSEARLAAANPKTPAALKEALGKVRNFGDLVAVSPKMASEVRKMVKVEEKGEISMLTGSVSQLLKDQAEGKRIPALDVAVKDGGGAVPVESLGAGQIATFDKGTHDELFAGVKSGKLQPVSANTMKLIKNMEVLEQTIIPVMAKTAKGLPDGPGWKTVLGQVANPWLRAIGTEDATVQQLGAMGAFSLRAAAIFQGANSALSDNDRKAAALLVLHDGDSMGSAIIKIGIMQRMAGVTKMVHAGVSPEVTRKMQVFTEAEVAKLAADIRAANAQSFPLGGDITVRPR